LSVFLPKLLDAEDRGRFLFSYALILFGIMTGAIILFWLFPEGFEFFLQREFDMQNYGWFVLLTIMVVSTEMLANTASGLMLIRIAAIGRQMIRLILLPLVTFLYFLKRDVLVDYGLSLILGGFVAGYILAAIICAVGIYRERRFIMRVGWLLPSGFWAFSSTTMLSAVFAFLYANIDRLAVYSVQDLEGLGTYQAVLSINALIEKIPLLLRPSLVPTFSSLLGANHHTAFRQAFSLLSRWAVVPVTLVSLIVMAFSREILGVFGSEYVNYAYLLTLFGLVGIIRSLNVSTYVVNTCLEQNAFRFIQQFLNIFSQGLLTLIFMSDYGVLAIAGAKMFSVSVASFAGVLYVFFGLDMGKKLPLSYRSAMLVGVGMTILRIWVIPPGWLSASILATLCIVMFLIISRFSLNEIWSVIQFASHHDGKKLMEAGINNL
jgi:O-antigen/teichoic acid export membrane protein